MLFSLPLAALVPGSMADPLMRFMTPLLLSMMKESAGTVRRTVTRRALLPETFFRDAGILNFDFAFR